MQKRNIPEVGYMFILQSLLVLYLTAAIAMSAALCRHYPQFMGWANVSRGMAWPVTIYEIVSGLIDE
jgi:hypothetical protein